MKNKLITLSIFILALLSFAITLYAISTKILRYDGNSGSLVWWKYFSQNEALYISSFKVRLAWLSLVNPVVLFLSMVIIPFALTLVVKSFGKNVTIKKHFLITLLVIAIIVFVLALVSISFHSQLNSTVWVNNHKGSILIV